MAMPITRTKPDKTGHCPEVSPDGHGQGHIRCPVLSGTLSGPVVRGGGVNHRLIEPIRQPVPTLNFRICDSEHGGRADDRR